MSDDSSGILKAQIRRELERREKLDPVSMFPWHAQQRWMLFKALDTPVRDPRVVLVCGGNRGGKSGLGKGLYADTMRRKNRLAKKLRMVDKYTGEMRNKNDRDPITVWIIPPTLEKARQDWVTPTDGYSIRYWLGDLFMDEKKTPDHVFYSRPPGMTKEEADVILARGDLDRLDKTILKSHDQDLLSFEASSVDLAIVDEEIQEQAKWNSLLLRIGTTNGTLVMCYTPLHGLSWSYDRYWKPVVKNRTGKYRVGQRRWIKDSGKGAVVIAVQFGAAANPLATEYAEEIANDPGMSDAEKAARLYGEYGFVEGALIPALSGLDVIAPEEDHKVYVVDHLPGERERGGQSYDGRIVEYRLITDPNKSYGAVLSALDREGNIFWLAEHLEEAWPDRKHAEAFTKMIARHCRPGVPVIKKADPGSAGAQSIVNMADLGHMFAAIEKGAGSVSDGVKRMRSMAWVDPEHVHPITGEKGAPRMFFYRPGLVNTWKDASGHTSLGCRLAEQISQARQTDNPNAPPDTPHKSIRSKLDLFDCARYTCVDIQPGAGSGDDEVLEAEKKHDHMIHSLPLPGRERHLMDDEFYIPLYDE
jgi:hypothetical protein